MSELGFWVFNQAFSLGAEVLYAGLLAAFFRPFVPRERWVWRLLLVFAVYLFFELVCGWAALPQGLFGPILALLLLAASRRIGLEKSMTLLLTLLYFNARISSGLIAESLYFLLERFPPFPTEPLEAVFLRAALLVTLFLLSHAVLFAVMLILLRRRLLKRRFPLRWQELCCLGLVPAAGILFGQVIARLLIEFRDGVLLQLYERHPAFLALVPALGLLFYAGAWLNVVFQQNLSALREEQALHCAEFRQVQAMRARIREAEQFYDRLRRMRHDLRGHLGTIRGLVRSGAYDSLEDYIARMDGELGAFELELRTGSPVTDVIVGGIRRRCQDLGIRFEVDFYFLGAFDAFDVGIILQNLLENAVEASRQAAEGQRWIALSGKRRGRFFLIEVRNSFVGQVAFGADGLPVTAKKENPSMHGIGLSNVRREAEKYMGELELRAEGQVFSAVVLMQERSGL